MRKQVNSKSRYMPGLDGLRAISVLAVIAYHLNLNWAPGGYLGVGVFFVLSGYLITDQLVARWQRDRSLALGSFWLRRARRLLPAMLLMTAVVCAYLGITDPQRLGTLGGDVLSAVTYVNNWWLIFHKVSYFESFGPPSPFGHYWSLAVEEQFYLVWPLLLAIGLRFIPQRGKLAAIILALAAASAAAMALMYTPGSDPSRVYYGSDTRVFGLLIGAVLAVIWPSGKLTEAKAGAGSRVALNVFGLASLAALLYMMWRMQEYDIFVYRGGLVLLSVASAVLVATLAHPASGIARLLSVKPLRWLGVRSYGIYLWHYPVIALTTPVISTDGPSVTRIALQAAASIILAALSWKFVEEPILRGTWRKAVQAGSLSRLSHRMSRGARKHAAAIAAAGLTVVLCVSCIGTGSVGGERSAAASDTGELVVPASAAGGVPSNEGISNALGGGASSGAASSGAASNAIGSGASDKGAPRHAGSGSTNPASGDHAGKQTDSDHAPIPADDKGASSAGSSTPAGDEAASDEAAPKSGEGITIIGDSVILGVKSTLEEQRPGIVVDGKIGRQLTQAFDTIDSYEKAGALGDIVILELGTNGTFTAKKLSQLLDAIGDQRHILLINTRVPRKWQDEVNKMLSNAAEARDNVALVDWYAASKGKDGYFAKDGVHLNSEGAASYAEMLTSAVDKLKLEA
ncbi:acyltransferase family protein [Cohnella lubricantis]|uniref:Acetyltransferase n=1 Tax=Cohnella lubricantis TaxID=2163172 RepID=A0A841T5M8_9BACL|nr:acyltransferase family protein [Cohnella lubricantis]MBB6676624.1 acetyltransferase [Cohnella lubricantis]MBP2117365.1 peptidoglycan/LPS O-acetylase OafA/YrhL/lysophospholipase L1-like esterase [Cohnella lubricantis]